MAPVSTDTSVRSPHTQDVPRTDDWIARTSPAGTDPASPASYSRRPSYATSLSASKPVAKRSNPRETMRFEDLEKLVSEEHHLLDEGYRAMERFLTLLQRRHEDWEPLATDNKSVVYRLRKSTSNKDAFTSRNPVYKGFTLIENVTPRQVLTVLQHRDLWDDWIVEYHTLQPLSSGDQRMYYAVFKPPARDNRIFSRIQPRDAVFIDRTLVTRRMIIADDDPCRPVWNMNQVSDSSILYCQRTVDTVNVPHHSSRVRLDFLLSAWKLDAVKLQDGSVGTSVSFYYELLNIGANLPKSALNFYASRRCFCVSRLRKHFVKYGIKYLPLCIERNKISTRKMVEFQTRVAQRYKEHAEQFEASLQQHTQLINSTSDPQLAVTASKKKGYRDHKADFDSTQKHAILGGSPDIPHTTFDTHEPIWRYPSDVLSALSEDNVNLSGIGSAPSVSDVGSISYSEDSKQVASNPPLIISPGISLPQTGEADPLPLRTKHMGAIYQLGPPASKLHDHHPSLPMIQEDVNDVDISIAVEDDIKDGVLSYYKKDLLEPDETIDHPCTPNNTRLKEVSDSDLLVLSSLNKNIPLLAAEVLEDRAESKVSSSKYDDDQDTNDTHEKDIILNTSGAISSLRSESVADIHAESYRAGIYDLRRNTLTRLQSAVHQQNLDLSRKFSTVRANKKAESRLPRLDTIFVRSFTSEEQHSEQGKNNSEDPKSKQSITQAVEESATAEVKDEGKEKEDKVEKLAPSSNFTPSTMGAIKSNQALAAALAAEVSSRFQKSDNTLVDSKTESSNANQTGTATVLTTQVVTTVVSKSVVTTTKTKTIKSPRDKDDSKSDEQSSSKSSQLGLRKISIVIPKSRFDADSPLFSPVHPSPIVFIGAPESPQSENRSPEENNVVDGLIRIPTLSRRIAGLNRQSSRYSGMNFEHNMTDGPDGTPSQDSYLRTLSINGISIREQLLGTQRCRVDPFLPIVSQAYAWRNSPRDAAASLFCRGLVDYGKEYDLFSSGSDDGIKCRIPQVYSDIENAVNKLHSLADSNTEWIPATHLSLSLKSMVDTLQDGAVSFTKSHGVNALRVDFLIRGGTMKKYSYIDGESSPSTMTILQTLAQPQSRQLWDTTIRGDREEVNTNWDKLRALALDMTQTGMSQEQAKAERRAAISHFASKPINVRWRDPQTFTTTMEAAFFQFGQDNNVETLTRTRTTRNKDSDTSSSWGSEHGEAMDENPKSPKSPTTNGGPIVSEPVEVTTFISWNNRYDCDSAFAVEILSGNSVSHNYGIVDDNSATKLLGAWIVTQVDSETVHVSRFQILPEALALSSSKNGLQANSAVRKLTRLIFDANNHIRMGYFAPTVPYVSLPSDVSDSEREKFTSKGPLKVSDMMYGVIPANDRTESPEVTSWSLMYPDGVPDFIGNVQSLVVTNSAWDSAHRVFTAAAQGTSGTMSIILPRYPLDVIRRKGLIVNVSSPEIITSQLDYFNVCCEGFHISTVRPKLRIDVSSYECSLLYVNVVDSSDKKLNAVDAHKDTVTVTFHIPAPEPKLAKSDGVDVEKGAAIQPTGYNPSKLLKHGLKKRIGVRIEYLGIVVEHESDTVDKNGNRIVHSHEYLRNSFDNESESDPCCVFWPFE